MKILIIVVLVLAVILGFAFWKYAPTFTEDNKTPPPPPIITVWGFEEDEKLLKLAGEEYKKIHPEVTINFVKQSTLNYRARVQNQVKNSQGPDLFKIHNSWIPMFLTTSALYPAPKEVYELGDYAVDFYPVSKETLTYEDRIYSMSYGIDGLLLYYNEEILKNAGVIVPTNWAQFVAASVRTTVPNPDGSIQTAGAAMGTTENVDFWPEILSLLFLQEPGASLEQPNTPSGANVLKFFTDFVTDPNKKTWDRSLPSSTEMFAKGRLTFYFAPASQARVIRELNPNLNFKVTKVPQLPGRDVGLAGFWGYGVSSSAKNPNLAWDFLKFLTSDAMQLKLFVEESKLKGMGFAFSKVDLRSDLEEDPVLSAVVLQAPVFKSWYLNSYTGDQGINDAMIAAYQSAVDSSGSGQNPLSSLQSTAGEVAKILNEYKPPQAAPPPVSN